MVSIGKIASTATDRVGGYTLGQTIGNLAAGRIQQAQQEKAQPKFNLRGGSNYDAAAKVMAIGSDLDAQLQGLSSVFESDGAGSPVVHAVTRGDTVEAIARDHYGENWRAGVAAIVAGNGLKTNANGSPLIYAGSDIALPSLDGVDLAAANRAGGSLVANNTLQTWLHDPAVNNWSVDPTGGRGAFQPQTFASSYDPGLFGSGGALFGYADQVNIAVAERSAGQMRFVDGLQNGNWGDAGLGALQMLGSGVRFVSTPVTGTLETVGLMSGHTLERSRYDADFLTAVGGLATGVGGLTRGGIFAAETTAPRTFSNLFPEDLPRTPNIIPNDRLLTMSQRNLAYVVTEDGTLIVGKNNQLQGHIDLAGGQPVQAAGEFGVHAGELKFVDNFSGHYRPSGIEPQTAAENAFRKAGFDVNGKYVERKF